MVDQASGISPELAGQTTSEEDDGPAIPRYIKLKKGTKINFADSNRDITEDLLPSTSQTNRQKNSRRHQEIKPTSLKPESASVMEPSLFNITHQQKMLEQILQRKRREGEIT